MKVTVEPFELYGWKGHRLISGPLKLVIAPSIGGRIISLRYEGRELLFTQKEHAGEVFDFASIDNLNEQKKLMGFRVWGGDKTWVAPQVEWSEGIPPLELDAGAYDFVWEEPQVVMTSPICRETGLRIVRKISFDQESNVYLTEEFHNTTVDRVIRKGIWNVTQLIRPCMFYVPADKGSFRSYHQEDQSLPDVKSIFIEDEGWVEIPCRTNQLFKCGGMPNEGQVLLKVPMGGRRDLVWLKTFKVDKQAEYAHKAAVEVFNSDRFNYAEIELHGSLTTLEPGTSCSFVQQWRFKKI